MNADPLFEGAALAVPEILVPARTIDLKKWAVIACDQYTQDSGYWERVAAFTRGSPSALDIILPEIYLESEGTPARIAEIKAKMLEFLGGGIFAPPVKGFVYVERKTSRGKTRKGLLCAIDLEKYDWRHESKAEIRATEETIAERLPPRMEIRRGSALEIPHIMLLANDPERALVEGAGEMARLESDEPLYKTELMENAGSITAWKLAKEEHLARAARALSALAERSACPDGSRFLFAVGDGNHSLATAKAVWEEYKKGGARQSHPARHALAEIVNLYDEGLTFEPIHRAIFGARLGALSEFISARTGAKAASAQGFEEALAATAAEKDTAAFALVQRGKAAIFRIETAETAAAIVQPALDAFLRENPAAAIDYIHGAGEARRLSEKEGVVAILMPPMQKAAFFDSIAKKGALPRKSFSLGEADEKRFYLECRKIL